MQTLQGNSKLAAFLRSASLTGGMQNQRSYAHGMVLAHCQTPYLFTQYLHTPANFNAAVHYVAAVLNQLNSGYPALTPVQKRLVPRAFKKYLKVCASSICLATRTL